MITPLEIQEKEFSRGLKGFKEDEVNEFLDQITLDLERLLADNRQLYNENEQLKAELKKFQDSEHSIIDTLETAKALMGDISASAEKRAQILIQNAELEAQTMLREAKEAVARMNEENATIKNRLVSFRKRYKELLEKELKDLDDVSTELYAKLSIEDLSDIPDARPSAGKASVNVPRETMQRTMINSK